MSETINQPAESARSSTVSARVDNPQPDLGQTHLPQPLIFADGSPITDPQQWPRRRGEILRLFEQQVYGKLPGKPPAMRFELRCDDPKALGAKATRREIRVHLTDDPQGPSFDLLIYLPNDRTGPTPMFLGLNFFGNHTVHADPGITLSTAWMREAASLGIENHRATEASRGVQSDRWPVEQLLARGYGLATVYCGDLDPDFDDGFHNGIHPLFYRDGQTKPDADEGATISAWAWGLCRAMDYLTTDADVDDQRVTVMGHSRLGKTALWAGAQDQRFALAWSNCSGCGGACLTRHLAGEGIHDITERFPHWFCENYKHYANDIEALPVDQHMLIALIAPRPVLVCSADQDAWADPPGEFLAAKLASPVYELLGSEGLNAQTMPEVNHLIGSRIGYHIRPGKHGLTARDWAAALAFRGEGLRAQAGRSPA